MTRINPLFDLFTRAAAGHVATVEELDALPAAPGTYGAWKADVRDTLAELNRMRSEGRHGDARQHARLKAALLGGHLDDVKPARPNTDSMSPAELAGLVHQHNR